MARDELAARIAVVALLRGTFTLRSGRTSHYYLDKYRFTCEPTILSEIGRQLAARIEPGTARLAGAELGGIPLVTAASLASGLPAVYVRATRKGYGTGEQIEGRLEAGDRVMVVEDVCTTGGQILEASHALAAAGAQVVKIVATIDREEGARERLEAAGYSYEALFTCADLGIDEPS